MGASGIRAVVTGAAGFLGLHLVDTVRRESGTVLPVVRAVTGEAPPGSVAVADVLSRPSLLDGYDVLIHAAAVRHRHGIGVAEYRASNVDLVRSLLEACAGRVGRFVLVSSVGVFGFPSHLPITESHPFAPRTLYSVTKVEAEAVVRRRSAELGLPFSIVRPTIVYGKGDRNGMLDKLAAMIRSGRYRVVGDGQNTLHHTYVDDIVRGILAATASPAALGEDFILAGPETITLERLGERVAEAVGKPLPRLHVPLPFARFAAGVFDVLAYRGIGFENREPPINSEKLDVMAVL